LEEISQDDFFYLGLFVEVLNNFWQRRNLQFINGITISDRKLKIIRQAHQTA
jgi:hypothetical protein